MLLRFTFCVYPGASPHDFHRCFQRGVPRLRHFPIVNYISMVHDSRVMPPQAVEFRWCVLLVRLANHMATHSVSTFFFRVDEDIATHMA